VSDPAAHVRGACVHLAPGAGRTGFYESRAEDWGKTIPYFAEEEKCTGVSVRKRSYAFWRMPKENHGFVSSLEKRGLFAMKKMSILGEAAVLCALRRGERYDLHYFA